VKRGKLCNYEHKTLKVCRLTHDERHLSFDNCSSQHWCVSAWAMNGGSPDARRVVNGVTATSSLKARRRTCNKMSVGGAHVFKHVAKDIVQRRRRRNRSHRWRGVRHGQLDFRLDPDVTNVQRDPNIRRSRKPQHRRTITPSTDSTDGNEAYRKVHINSNSFTPSITMMRHQTTSRV